MKVGFIGAGRAGCSLGKYFAVRADRHELQVTGYYSLNEEDAKWAAAFTESECFTTAEDVIAASDTILISTPDGAVKHVWESCNKDNGRGKIICHLSGSLSSDVFSGIEQYEAYPLSIHPMFAFSNREFVYEQLNEVSFTLEGHAQAVSVWRSLLTSLGNPVIEITKDGKAKYHAAASLLSNHVVAVLSAGYELLYQCGFTEEQARSFSAALVRHNVEHVICQGAKEALTGPVERADVGTIQSHLAVLDDLQKEIYLSCGRELVRLAKQKNPDRDYEKTEELLRSTSRP